MSGRQNLWVSAVGTCIALEGHKGLGQYLGRGNEVWDAWAGSGSTHADWAWVATLQQEVLAVHCMEE